MSQFRPVLMIRAEAAKQVTDPTAIATLTTLLGGSLQQPDPENEGETINIIVTDVYDLLTNHRHLLPAVQATMPIRQAGDKVTMHPDGYPEEFIFPVILSDRIPGETEKERQENRQNLKTMFDQMTTGAGSSWTARYLSTKPEVDAYLKLIENPNTHPA